MLQVIRTLARYGMITMEAKNRMWKVGCMVRLPAGIKEGYVSCFGERLCIALERLVPLVKEKEKELWIEFRKPKQQSCNYGTGKNGESHP